jgi:hypothetical protein
VRGFDDDFVGIAATVRWERWLPERPSFETLDERMQDGDVSLSTNDDVVRACDRWLEAWEGFKLHLGPDQARVRAITLFAARVVAPAWAANANETATVVVAEVYAILIATLYWVFGGSKGTWAILRVRPVPGRAFAIAFVAVAAVIVLAPHPVG